VTELLPTIVLGAGGHAKVVINALQALDVLIMGVTDPDPKTHGKNILGVTVLGNDDVVFEQAANTIVLVNGVGSTNVSDRRRTINQKFLDAGYSFRSVVHPSAIIGGETEISEGAQVMAGVVIQPGCHIGVQTIINTRSSVDHDCIIGAYTHIAPGAVLGGGITVGENCHIGAGAIVIQNIKIGSKVLVGAGSSVISKIPDGSRVAGTPARNM
jgi:sugar O-acyltransferase (sialic acid O-acetyltransferase NeuD family)